MSAQCSHEEERNERLGACLNQTLTRRASSTTQVLTDTRSRGQDRPHLSPLLSIRSASEGASIQRLLLFKHGCRGKQTTSPWCIQLSLLVGIFHLLAREVTLPFQHPPSATLTARVVVFEFQSVKMLLWTATKSKPQPESGNRQCYQP